MHGKLAKLTLGLCFLASFATAASAGGDWPYGGMRGQGAGVPVPAPIPVPIYEPLWYLRADVSLGFSNDADPSQRGLVFGEGDGDYSTTPFGVQPTWMQDHFSQHAMYGGGFGYRWSGWFRTDFTAESMRERSVTINGVATAVPLLDEDGAVVPGTYDVSIRDSTSMRAVVMLANGYVDLPSWGPVRPYVGGGIGVALARAKRNNVTTEIARETGETADVVVNSSSGSGENQYALAAAAAAGVSYAFTDALVLDIGYRYLWLDSMYADLIVNGNPSRVSIDPTSDHQLRMGLRLNIE